LENIAVRGCNCAALLTDAQEMLLSKEIPVPEKKLPELSR
jgi:hypothetical protein